MGLLGLCAVLFSFAEPRNPITNASYPVGSQVPYRCRPGYVGVSDKSFMVTCLPNNTWAWDPDFCIGKSCPEPDIENGKFHYSTDLRFGATINFTSVTYTCNEGFSLIGSSTIYCTADAECFLSLLTLLTLFLTPLPCELFLVSCQGEFAQGSIVVYKCNHGFVLAGGSSIRCTARDEYHGVWSTPTPECRSDYLLCICTPSQSLNLLILGEQRLHILCLCGEQRRCTRCREERLKGCIIRCPPPYIKNGKSKSAARYIYRAGASVSFTCNPGYTLQGSPTSTCQADSRWSPPLPECKKGKCPSGCASGAAVGGELPPVCSLFHEKVRPGGICPCCPSQSKVLPEREKQLRRI
uniref:Sushi domain-containing protein n=1 Tax=Anas platyrhynchos platyrhynchos TaxID=8840 RepID=A0A493TB19_ANAPP